ncbi:MAG: hypothetical protein ACREQ1_13630, partial [Woeseiaceae bacterium]
MLKWLDRIGRVVILAFAVIVVYRFWIWWAPEEPETYLRTDLVTAQESDSFITGFAMLSLLLFDVGTSQLEPFEVIEDRERRRNVKGFCYRLYELAIGYDSLWATVKDAEASLGTEIEIGEPRVLAADIVEARQGGDDTSQLECDRLNQVGGDVTNDVRLDRLEQALIDNGQWDSHVRHARNVVTTFSTTIAERRREVLELRIEKLEHASRGLNDTTTAGEYNEWLEEARDDLDATTEGPAAGERASLKRSTGIAALDEATPLEDSAAMQDRGPGGKPGQLDEAKKTIGAALGAEASQSRLAFADAGGFLGTLKLTFTTVGIFSQTARKWLFWEEAHFYVRKDFADATYGSDFMLDFTRSRGGPFSPRRLEVTLPEPYLLALDRYTTTVVANPPDFRLDSDGDTGNMIEQNMKDDLQRQIDRVEPQAIRFAQALLTAQIQQLVQADVAEVSVRFERRDAGTPQ